MNQKIQQEQRRNCNKDEHKNANKLTKQPAQQQEQESLTRRPTQDEPGHSEDDNTAEKYDKINDNTKENEGETEKWQPLDRRLGPYHVGRQVELKLVVFKIILGRVSNLNISTLEHFIFPFLQP